MSQTDSLQVPQVAPDSQDIVTEKLAVLASPNDQGVGAADFVKVGLLALSMQKLEELGLFSAVCGPPVDPELDESSLEFPHAPPSQRLLVGATSLDRRQV